MFPMLYCLLENWATPMGVAMMAVIEATWVSHSNALYSPLLGYMHVLCNMTDRAKVNANSLTNNITGLMP